MLETIQRLNAALSGRYTIERELGAGGMATVYLARDEKHDRNVAVKVLRPELAAVVGAERFLTEIRTTANLQHPHILPLFDSGEADTFLFYVMPYVEGETLQDRMDREKQLPVTEALRLGAAVAGALDYAHRQGVIHRDIKPANILLHDGQPVVADFGIALAVSAAGGGRLTETGLSLGTPFYMSPEQATADRDPDARSDLYSLACVVYEMLTGEPPFQGSTAQAVLGKIITSEPTRPTEHRKSIPPHVEAVILKALQKVPADRFDSAAEFAEALTNPVVGGTLVRQAVAGGGPGARSSRTVQALAAATVLLAALAAWGWLRPAPEARVARYAIAPPETVGVPNGDRGVGMLPDGSGFVYRGRDADGTAALWLRKIDKLDATRITGTDDADGFALSPDGTSVVFNLSTTGTSDGDELRVVELTGGGRYTLTDSLVDRGILSWGDDGYIYYDGHLEDDGIARVPANGGSPEIVTRLAAADGEIFHFEPSALPDGKGVLFTVTRGDINIGDEYQVAVVGAPDSGHRALLVGHTPMYVASGHLVFVRGTSLMAAPFDVDRLEVTGPEVVIAADVMVGRLATSSLASSETGTFAYWAGGEAVSTGVQLVWVDRSGAATAIDGDQSEWIVDFALSPDGRLAALSVVERQESHIWIQDLVSGGSRKVTFEGSENSQPAWTPTGDEVVYRHVGSEIGLYQVPADGRALPRSVLARSSGQSSGAAPAYSPDGRWLLFNNAGSDSQLYAVPATGDTTAIPLVAAPDGQSGQGQVSPDGRWLAYASNESGTPQVYVRPFPETAGAKSLVSRESGFSPKWSADGSEVFYLTMAGDMMVAEVVSGASFSSSQPIRLFARGEQPQGTGLEFSVHPDGQRFLMTRYAEGSGAGGGTRPEPQLVIVENFFKVLRERAGR